MTSLFGKAAFGTQLHSLARAIQLVHFEVRCLGRAGSTGLRVCISKRFPGIAKHLPVLQQAQAGASGLTCMAMIAIYHRNNADLPGVQRKLALPAQELKLAQLVRVAGKMSMSCRPRRIPASRLAELRLPVILQWESGRYVVLKRVQGRQLSLHDPAAGMVTVSMEQALSAFAGIVLECEPLSEFGRYRESWVR